MKRLLHGFFPKLLFGVLSGGSLVGLYAGPVVVNGDGDKFEVIEVSGGPPQHVFDSRTLIEKALAKLPKDLRDKTGIPIQGARIELPASSKRSIGVGIKSDAFYRSSPEQIHLFLSDESGWYQGQGLSRISMNVCGVLFGDVPRMPETLTLNFYGDAYDPTQACPPFGSIQIANPFYDAKATPTGLSFPAQPIKSGPLELKIRHFITGVDGNDKTGADVKYRSMFNGEATTDTMDWVEGKVQPARMPQRAYTLLVFDVTSSGSKVENLRFQDNRYQSYYQQGNTYALMWERNVYRNDGNREFFVPAAQPPPSDSPNWRHSQLVDLADLTTGSRNLVNFEKQSIEWEKTNSPGKLKITLYDYNDLVLEAIPIMVRDAETSQAIPFSLKCETPTDGNYQNGVINVDRTTGTVVLSFAKGTRRLFLFNGVPDQAK